MLEAVVAYGRLYSHGQPDEAIRRYRNRFDSPSYVFDNGDDDEPVCTPLIAG